MNVRIPLDSKPDELDAHAFVDVRFVFPAGITEADAETLTWKSLALVELDAAGTKPTATILQVDTSNSRPRRADDRAGFDAIAERSRRVDALLGDDAA